MTREEAKSILGDISAYLASRASLENELIAGHSFIEICNAIKALGQEPCELIGNSDKLDCISRAELLKAIDTWDKFGCTADTKLVPYKDHYIPYIHYDDVIKCIKGMPGVKQEPKTDILDKINNDIQTLRGCSCSCSDGIIDDVEDIIDKYRQEV